MDCTLSRSIGGFVPRPVDGCVSAAIRAALAGRGKSPRSPQRLRHADAMPDRNPSRRHAARESTVAHVSSRDRNWMCMSANGQTVPYPPIRPIGTMAKESRRYRLTVRTEPSQGLNTGSIPVSATMFSITYGQCAGTRWHAQPARSHC